MIISHKYASATAIRSCDNSLTIFNTHTQIHKSADRALLDQMLSYKHALLMHQLFNSCQPDLEFMHLNFQLNQNPRLQKANFFNRQNYEAGTNILLNRLSHLNNKIEKSWLVLSLNAFKIKCKSLFLSHNWANFIGYQTSPLRSLPIYVQFKYLNL